MSWVVELWSDGGWTVVADGIETERDAYVVRDSLARVRSAGELGMRVAEES